MSFYVPTISNPNNELNFGNLAGNYNDKIQINLNLENERISQVNVKLEEKLKDVVNNFNKCPKQYKNKSDKVDKLVKI